MNSDSSEEESINSQRAAQRCSTYPRHLDGAIPGLGAVGTLRIVRVHHLGRLAAALAQHSRCTIHRNPRTSTDRRRTKLYLEFILGPQMTVTCSIIAQLNLWEASGERNLARQRKNL